MQEFVNILLTYHPFTLPLMLVFYSSNHPGLFLNLIPGKTSFGVYADIYGVSSTANSLVYSGSLKFHKKILWLINTSTTLTSATLRTEVGMIPIDGMAGGVLDLESYLDDIPAEFQEFVKQPKFCFIPRGSALALNDWDTNYSANLQGQDLFALNKTSFEHTAMPLTVPESHVTFDATKQFVINQLKDNPISPDTFLPSFCGNQTVTVKNPLSRPLSWTVSDNAFTVTSPTNTSAVIGGLM